MTDYLLERYFTNQVTPDEAERVLNWFNTDAGRAYLTQRLDAQLGKANWHAPPDLPIPHADELWQPLQRRLAPSPTVAEAPVRRLGWLNQPMRWAAVLVGILLLTTAAFQAYRRLNPSEVVQQTAFGKTSRFTLSDGSVVILNGNSRLRYAPQWVSGQMREVWLDGEGFFKVTHQRNHERFVVHLPNRLNIEVLGTQFDVLARKSRAKVVLNNGRIRLDVGERAKEKLVMLPGDLFYADMSTRTYYRKRVDPAVLSAWKEGKLRFNGTTLDEVAQMLEETYGVTVVIADPELRHQALSGTIPNNSIETILNGLSTLFDLRITRQTNRIVIQ